MNWLNQLRLRAAYGASGRQPGTTDAVQYYSTTTAIAAGLEQPGLIYTALGNSNLKPERSTELETGFDLTAWDSRVNTEFTFYNKRSKDALIQEIIPGSVGTGATSRFANLGEIQNKGIEYLISAQLLQRDEFGWDVSFNGSHNSNKIVSLGGTPPQRGSRISQIEGYPLNSFWLKPYTYGDANGNGIIEPSEVTVGDTTVYAGYSQPRTELSFTNGIDLWRRRVRVTALLDYKGGYKIWNGTYRYRCVSFVNCRDIYDPKTPLDLQARAIAAGFVTNTTDYGYVEDGSFLRLREVAVNFDLPSSWASRYARASRVALNLSARNLHIWTDYTGIDPESNYGQGDVQNDFLTQPPQTYFQLRLTLGY
jgi:outer membrane receptor protein involved in Fe transport